MSEPSRLLVLRHGRAAGLSAGGDRHRPLTDAGELDVQRVGAALQGRGLMPEHTIASPALRTRTTAARALTAGGHTTTSLGIDERIYDAELDDLLAAVADAAANVSQLLLVGHNPGVSGLIRFLSGVGVDMRSGMLSVLEMPHGWGRLEPSAARLADVIRPEELDEMFPFPGPGSTERRSRPAYYYRQSAVVPYRLTPAGLEILIIGSSENKHWVVPKGIVEPGLTARDSAANEALGEAGVRGHISERAVGEIEYAKWGASVRCSVYAMAVTDELRGDQWLESHRGRQWVGADEAAARLRPELSPMIAALRSSLQ